MMMMMKKDLNMCWSYINKFKYNLRDKLDISKMIEDMENLPPESQMWFGVDFMGDVVSSKALCHDVAQSS